MTDPVPAESTRRDSLALIRTQLANERTLLAYGRTSLMIAATAVTVMKFFPDLDGSMGLTIGLGAVSAVVFIVGVGRFRKLQRQLNQTD